MEWIQLLLLGVFGFQIESTHGMELSTMTEDWQSWPLEELELQMSPSRWNPTKTADEVVAEYISVSIAETMKSKENVPHEANVPYVTDPKSAEFYDVYGTDLINSSVFFWCHGGYWQEGSKDMSGLLAHNLASHGIKNIVLGYTLAPNATVREIFGETISALKHAMDKFPNSQFIVGGHSAGAQLSAMLLHSTDLPESYIQRLKGFALVSGVYDLRLLVPTYVNIALNMSEADAESLSPLRLREINPVFKQRASDVKILIFTGEYDSPEFRRQSEEYRILLGNSFPFVELFSSSGDDHFTLVQNMTSGQTTAGSKFTAFMKNFNNPGSGSTSSFLLSGMLIFTSAIVAVISNSHL